MYLDGTKMEEQWIDEISAVICRDPLWTTSIRLFITVCLDAPPTRSLRMCMVMYQAFFYNQTTHACHSFLHRGCGGSRNSFFSLDECQNTCL